jgi:hypothetical protein
MCPPVVVANFCCGRSLKDDDGGERECRLSKIGQFDRGKVQFVVLLHCSLVSGAAGSGRSNRLVPETGAVPETDNTSEFLG